jgi:hypothetical protein
VAQTQQTVPKWLICNELQNKHPPHSGEAAPFFSYFKFLRKWYEIDIFEFSGSPMTNDANIWHFYGSAD